MNPIRKDSGPNDPTLNDAPSELSPPAWGWLVQLLVAKITVESDLHAATVGQVQLFEPHSFVDVSTTFES
jgi:hypothetical protein